MNSGYDWMLQREVGQYKTSLDSWVQQVTHCRSAEQALTRAFAEPHPGSLLRGMASLYNSDKAAAHRRVDQVLEKHLAGLPVEEASRVLPRARAVAVHFPSVRRWIEEQMRPSPPSSPGMR